MIEGVLRQLVRDAVFAAQAANALPRELGEFLVGLEQPKFEGHGDLATNVALALAKPAQLAPRKIAEAIVHHLPTHRYLQKTEIAGPGFINFTINPQAYIEQLHEVMAAGNAFGQCDVGHGVQCLVEFVSVNPTGPLHVGHGRNALYGDVLASLLRVCGYDVWKEFYVNDAGVQIQTLGRSVLLRIQALQGASVVFPEDCYQGDYIIDLARSVLDGGHGTTLQEKDEQGQVAWLGQFASQAILEGIRHDLDLCGVTHDHYFFESSLHDGDKVGAAIADLQARGHIFEEEGALWFRSTVFGDDKDRVLRKSDGTYTYLSPDIAYHADKYRRGAKRLVNVLGADHGGYVTRLKAAVAALGHDAESLDCVLLQMVNLIRGGEMVSMSTRRGEFETLADLTAAVGKDVVRYFFLMRSHHAQLDFDLALAASHSMDNPVYYIQYAHARICSIFAKAAQEGVTLAASDTPDITLLNLPEEGQLARYLGEYPRIIELAGRALEPHRVTHYLLDLARRFQAYYTMGKRDSRYRVLGQPLAVAEAKLYLLKCVQIVLQNALYLLGLSVPERMERVEGDD